MTIIFDYLFTQTEDSFVCRVPIRILDGLILKKGASANAIDTPGTDLHQWVGKSLRVTINDGVYSITGVA